MKAALHDLIMAAQPAFYFKVHDLSAFPLVTNHGDQPISAEWKGSPSTIETHAGPFVRLTGPEWVELKGGPAALATGGGITVEALVLVDVERRAWWRLFEIGVNTTSPLVGLACESTSDDLVFRYWTPGQTSSSTKVSYTNLRDRLRHIAVVIDPVAAVARHYLDGVLIGSVPNSYTLATVNAALGNLFYSLWPQTTTSADQTLKGLASYVAVYLKPLTSANVAARAALIPQLGYSLNDLWILSGIYHHRLTAVPANQEPREQFLPNVAWSGSPPMWQGPVPTIALTCTPANQEPREVFQPQDVAWRGSPGFVVSGPVPDLPVADPMVLCKGSDNYWVRPASFNAGADVRNVEQGFIESTVTISGQGVRRRVLCFTQEGELVGETYSRAADGVYRFDLLWLNKRYMLVAQDDPAFGPADYNAVAADFQAPKPYPKGTGVPTPLLATKPMKKGT